MNIKRSIAHPFSFWITLSLLHICVLLLLYFEFGFSTLNEGDKYLSRAGFLANGDLINSTQYQTFYISYVVYLAIFIVLKLPTICVFLATYVLSLFAYYKFHQLITVLINKQTARLWILVMCLSPLIQYWQFNLFSETFFIAISLLFIYVCLFPGLKYRKIKLILLAIITVFSRPSGIFTVACILIYMLYKNKTFTKKQVLVFGSAVFLFLFIVILCLFQLPYHDFSKYISNGSVYYGFPGWNSPELPPGNYTLMNCHQFIIDHKGLKTWLWLFLQKINSFFVTTRPYYSNFHNIVNQTHQLLYPFALLSFFIAFKKYKATLGLLLSLLSIIILNALMIGFIFNEWSERHTLHVFPYIILLATYSITYFFCVFVKKQRNF
jgi:hypothetical protein